MKINSISSNLYNQNRKQTNNQTSFKALPQPITDTMAKAYETVAKTKPFQSFIKNFSKSDKTFTHLLVMESCFLSGFYMINTLRNKKIKKEQKPQMIINDTLTLGVSTLGAYLAEDKITNAIMKMSEKYFTKHQDFYTNLGKEAATKAKTELLDKVVNVAQKTGADLSQGLDDVASLMGKHLKNLIGEEGKLKAFQITKDKLNNLQTAVKETVTNSQGADKAKEAVSGIIDKIYDSSAARAEADKILPGINKLKVLVVFGLIYRYLSPVLFTPIANKLSEKFFSKKEQSADKAQNSK